MGHPETFRVGLKSPESFGNLEIWPEILGDSAGDSIG